MGVTVGGENLEDIAFARGNEFENGNVEGAPAEIVYGNFAALLFVQAIGERGRGWFIDEAEDFEASNFSGVFGGLALGVVEIGRDGNYGAIDSFPERAFGPIFQFAEDEGGDLGRREDF